MREIENEWYKCRFSERVWEGKNEIIQISDKCKEKGYDVNNVKNTTNGITER